MAIYKINQEGSTNEVEGLQYISPNDFSVKQIVEKYFIDPLTATAKLVWEYIFSFIFTHDGFGIQTKDGYIIKCKDQ